MEFCEAMKPGFHVNDDIGPEKQTILYVLRKQNANFQTLLAGVVTLTAELSLALKPHSPDQGHRDCKVMVNSVDKVRKPCSDTKGHNLETFLSTKPH